jgi:predicted RNA-binding protein (virulence factor B family)
MIELGRWNQLVVASTSNRGYKLTDGETEIWLDREDSQKPFVEGEKVRAFVMPHRGDGNIVATLKGPKLQVGEFGILRVSSTTTAGAFLHWGLERDLLLPFKYQLGRPQEGEWAFVGVIVDPSESRLIATMRWHRELQSVDTAIEGAAFQGVIAELYPDRADVIVDGKYWGVIPISDVRVGARVGDKIDGTIRSIRTNFLALGCAAAGLEGLDQLTPKLVEKLKANGGFLGLSDNSPPEAIRKQLEMSKGTYKKLIGRMQKLGLIEIEYHGIRLKS